MGETHAHRYEPRRPEARDAVSLVAEHLQDFAARAAGNDAPLPRFAVDELQSYFGELLAVEPVDHAQMHYQPLTQERPGCPVASTQARAAAATTLVALDAQVRENPDDWPGIVVHEQTNLRAVNLAGLELTGANLRNADLREADLRWAILRGADLRGANLSRARLHRTTLQHADLSGADIRSAVLLGANLEGATAIDANFGSAELSHAQVSNVDFNGADLRGAQIRSTNLRSALNLETLYLNSCRYCPEDSATPTEFPRGIAIPASCHVSRKPCAGLDDLPGRTQIEERGRVLELREQGLTDEEISKETGFSLRSVSHYLSTGE